MQHINVFQKILTGNRIGIINVFDTRNNENKSSTSLMISTEDDKRSNCVNCITYHPNQKHIVSIFIRKYIVRFPSK